MNVLVVPGSSLAFVSFGRWVAMCGYPFRCDGAQHLGPFQAGFICTDCGGATDVVWPAAEMVEGVNRLLLMRPHPKTRNWLPDETLPALLAENVGHGVMAGYDWTGVPLVVTDGRIVKDELPAGVTPRPELVA